MAITPCKKSDSTANLGFEAKLWLAADKLRNNMDAAEYKHVVLGLIFLKYISDTFEEHRAKLLAGEGDSPGLIPKIRTNTRPKTSSGWPPSPPKAPRSTPKSPPTSTNPAPSPQCATRCCPSC